MAHKLPRNTSCYTRSKNFPQTSDKQTCLITPRQYDCSSIHQQYGGNSLSSSNDSCERSLDVMPEKEHSSIGTTPTRQAERDVKDDERLIRLDAKSKNILENPGNNGSYGGGPICISANESSGSILQLETGPFGRSNRCISPGRDKSKGLCQSLLESNWKDFGQDETTGGKSDTNSSCIDISTTVSHLPEPVAGLPMENPTSAGSAVGVVDGIPTRNPPTTICVAYLRKSLQHPENF